MYALTAGLVLALVSPNFVDGAQFTLRNQCPFTVWPGTLTGGGRADGFALSQWQSASLERPPGWTGRFWGRTGCRFDQAGNGRCETGDCGNLRCNGGGVPPATLAEFTLAGWGGQDFYDVSLVDGFNLPVSIQAVGGSNCRESSCRVNVNANCPQELQVWASGSVVGCKSACLAWGRAEHCCTGRHSTPQTCPPSSYSQVFKRLCPDAYSYAYDDDTSTFTCRTGANYVIVFCP